MSDEQPPPSLRLKPRVTPPLAGDPAPPLAPAPVAPAPAEPTAADSLADPFRLRLKPKTPSEGAALDTSGVTFSTPQPFSAAPIPTVPEKPPLPVPVAAPLPVPPAPPAPPPLVPQPPPVAPRPLPPVAPPVSLVRPQHISTPRSITEPIAPVANAPSQRTYRADKWLAGIVVFLLVLVGGFYGVRYLIKANPKPKTFAKTAATPATAASPAAQPQPAAVSNKPHLVDNPTSSAGKAVAKVRDMIAARDKRDKEEGVESVLADTPASDAAKPQATSSAAPQPSSQPPAVVTAPVVTAPEPTVPPSDAFRQFVVNMRVNGVFQGENARAMLNGNMYHLGDVVDAKLSISFFKIDVDHNQLIFRDADGAIMARRY